MNFVLSMSAANIYLVDCFRSFGSCSCYFGTFKSSNYHLAFFTLFILVQGLNGQLISYKELDGKESIVELCWVV